MDPERYFRRRPRSRRFTHAGFYTPPYLSYNPNRACTKGNRNKAIAAAFASHFIKVCNQCKPPIVKQSDSTLTYCTRKRNASTDFEEYTDTSEAEDENITACISERLEKVDMTKSVDLTPNAEVDNQPSFFEEREKNGEVENMTGMEVETGDGKVDEIGEDDGINGDVDDFEEEGGKPKYNLRSQALIQRLSIKKNKELLQPPAEIHNREGTETKVRKGRRKVREQGKRQHTEGPDDIQPGEVDIQPIEIDGNVNFDDIGGLSQYVNALKEMVFFPLLYPKLYKNFNISPPKGILFCGPPGTGKTLVARALACAASKHGQKVSFYMRKGADVMSKWVGEAERHLTLLFEDARKNQPSIIFFDEIDGLAPARSSKLEHIHASVVSTLLALMDGLDSRGQVFLIGATNRVDDIDSALRRPGRFDCEFNFQLPCCEARAEILNIYTRRWKSPPSKDLRLELAARCVGYCGADLKSLCSQAVVHSFKEKYPQACLGDDNCLIDLDTVNVEKIHFLKAMSKIVPASLRSTVVNSYPLSPVVAPYLHRHLQDAMAAISSVFPFLNVPSDSWVSDIVFCRPKLLLVGDKLGVGLNHIRAAILHELEMFPIHSLALGSILGNAGTKSPEAALFQLFVEAKRSTPSVMYLPDLEIWCESGHEHLRGQLRWLLNELPCDLPILVLGASSVPFDKISKELGSIFDCDNVLQLSEVSNEDRSLFFDSILEAGLQVNNRGSGGGCEPETAAVAIDGEEEIFEIKQLLVEHSKSFGVEKLERLYPVLVNGMSGAKRSAKDGADVRACVLNYLRHFVSDNSNLIATT